MLIEQEPSSSMGREDENDLVGHVIGDKRQFEGHGCECECEGAGMDALAGVDASMKCNVL
jgi:hypothetical protein